GASAAWGQTPPASGWAQFQANAAHTGAADGPTPPYRVAWSLPVPPEGEQGLSAPVLSDQLGLVVAAAKTSVLGVGLDDGTKRCSIPRVAGPPASPAIAKVDGHDAVVFTEGSTSDNAKLRAVDLGTKHDLWKHPVALPGPSRTGVTVLGSTAIVG